MSGLSFKREEDEEEESKMITEVKEQKEKEMFTIKEVHEREKPLMLELNASKKEIERLKTKLYALHYYFNNIYNDALNPMGINEKDEIKRRLIQKANSHKNTEIIRELVYNKNTEQETEENVEVDRVKKLTIFEKLKGLFNV